LCRCGSGEGRAGTRSGRQSRSIATRVDQASEQAEDQDGRPKLGWRPGFVEGGPVAVEIEGDRHLGERIVLRDQPVERRDPLVLMADLRPEVGQLNIDSSPDRRDRCFGSCECPADPSLLGLMRVKVVVHGDVVGMIHGRRVTSIRRLVAETAVWSRRSGRAVGRRIIASRRTSRTHLRRPWRATLPREINRDETWMADAHAFNGMPEPHALP
jgi:hypothetical protein